MKIFSINDVLKWCQVFSNGRKYTCYTKMVDNNLYFKFKGKWHVVSEYVTELTSVYRINKCIYKKRRKIYFYSV